MVCCEALHCRDRNGIQKIKKTIPEENNMIPDWKIYPRSQGHSTVYLKNVVNDPTIRVGEYTTYDAM